MSEQQAAAADSEPGNNWSPTKIIGTALSAVGGLIAVVYIFGALVLLLRLQMKGLRAEVVVATLPREFLVSVGIAVLLQLVVVVGFLLAGLLLARRAMPSPTPKQQVAPRRRFRLLPQEPPAATFAALGASALASVALAVPLARWIGWNWWVVAVVAVAIPTAFVLAFSISVALRIESATLLTRCAVVTAFAFAIFVPWRVLLEWFSLEGLDAQVCTTSRINGTGGIMIGENDNAVYLGESDPPDDQSPRIVEIPRSDIKRVFLGKNAVGTSCDKD